MEFGHSGPWYHGSPFKLTVLRKESVVSPFKEVAKAFSHKPPMVSMSDDYSVVKHNGELSGFLYVLTDALPGDVVEMPGTDSTHWVIQRDMQVELLTALPVSDPPLLTEEEITNLTRNLPDGHTGFFSSEDDHE